MDGQIHDGDKTNSIKMNDKDPNTETTMSIEHSDSQSNILPSVTTVLNETNNNNNNTSPTTTNTAVETDIPPVSYAHSMDVIYGRGNHLKAHPGNVYYRSLVDSLKEYYATFTKDKKKIVSELIYESIKTQDPPGKFLAESHDRLYTELDMVDAVKKISQCFREKQPMIKACTTKEKKKLNPLELQVKLDEMRVCFLFHSFYFQMRCLYTVYE